MGTFGPFEPALDCGSKVSLFIQEFIQGAPKRPDTFENLIDIKRVDENN